MNVFSQSLSLESEKDDSLSDNISRYNKGGFRHFVEESTLRNVSLDELEELSDHGCSSGIDGNIRRTPSSVSSEQPVHFAIVLEWHSSYFNTGEGILRLALLVCSTISLACVSSAGSVNADILDLPFASCVRAHIFVTVLAILITLAFFILGVTALIESFPVYWNVIDAALHGSLCALLLFSSAMLLHAEHLIHSHEPPITDWAKVQLSLGAVFGFLSTIVCLFIAIIRSCAGKTPTVTDDIVLTSLQSS
ncbi:MARVEL domain-containing protein [Trichonephila clavata]|uniref:MARVEL domain-containing protein n=2 Tax=Trichonephila clavata TaxID=2740835 RepID=A0A8X6KTY8_TRICU|nr:MARVEL domain-containing protein [Trichonephila clavata]